MTIEIPDFAPGWIEDVHRVRDVIRSRFERGDSVMGASFVARHANELPGSWERKKGEGITGVFLRDHEVAVRGQYRRPFSQKHGTCVSRGMAKGVQVSLDYAISSGLLPLKPVEIAFAPIYTLARHECGHDRCGSGDGAILADAAKAVHDYGVATTEIFEGKTEDVVENLAVRFAAPGVGTPAEWIAAAKGHTCFTFWPETLGLIFDCIAAGYGVPYAHGNITGMPNADGISDIGSRGPHCRCFTGVFLDENGETQLESSESWGRFPAGQPQASDQTMPIEQMPRITLRYAGGSRLLAPGSVGVKAKRFWSMIQSGGEAWAVGTPHFETESLSEFVKAKLGARA